MKHIIKILLILLYYSTLMAQSYQSKIYNIQYLPEALYDVHVSKDNRIFAVAVKFCDLNVECSAVMELDSAMNVLWYRPIPWLDVWDNCLEVHNDTIAIAGNNRDTNKNFWIYHLTTSGDSIDRIRIDPPTGKGIHNMYFRAFTIFNNKYIITGQVSDSNEVIHACIFSTYKTGVLDTLMMYRNIPDSIASKVSYFSGCDAYVDPNNLLTLSFYFRGNSTIDKHAIVAKFDQDFNEVGHFEGRNYRTNPIIIPHITSLSNNQTVVCLPKLDDEQTTALQCFDKDNNFVWEFDWPNNPSYRRFSLANIITAKNGDILMCGAFYDPYLSNPKKIYRVAYLARVSPSGILLWEHAYSTIDQIEPDYLSISGLLEIQETAEGDIVAVGQISNKYIDFTTGKDTRLLDMFVIHTDANGCIDPGKCDDVNLIEVDITSDTKDYIGNQKQTLTIAPNPASDYMSISISEDMMLPLHYEIINIAGQRVEIGSHSIIDQMHIETKNMQAGLYIVQLRDKEGRVWRGKLIKE